MASKAKSFMNGSRPAAPTKGGKNSGILSARGSQKMDPGESGDETALMEYANRTGGHSSGDATVVSGGASRAAKTVRKDLAQRGG